MSVAVEKLLTPDILRPARYLGNELGAVHKPWESAAVRWVLAYPEVYEVGASNLGHLILYNILNAQPRQLCDRAYLPGADLVLKLRNTETPLFSVESKRSLFEFDILGFSLSYELGATNILEMLDLGGIPAIAQERSSSGPWNVEAGSWPLVFAGGQTATSNPEPYAEFFDFIALGDGEELLPEIGLVLQEGKAAGLTREELLFDLAQVPGVYVPQFYDMAENGSVHPNRPGVPSRVLRRVATPIPAYSIGLVPYVETVHDRLTIEVRRGCTRGCRFCQPGMLTRPARDVDPDQVMEAIEAGMRATGYNEFSLLSLSCSDYLALPAVGMEIKNRLKDQNISLSLPSQRVDRFDENIANILGSTRTSGLTFAPEAGTQRMRDIINKGLTNEELWRGIKTAYQQGWNKVKLYFMIGLPGETDADVLGIAETVLMLQQECRALGGKRLEVTLTISNFTPKPHTPFQWHSVSTAEFLRKQDLLRQEFRRMRGVKANFTDVRISAMEDFVGRGDRRLAPVVRRAWELGAGMDSWWENLDRAFGAWKQAIAESDLSWKYRQVENGEWNVMDGTSTDLDARLDAPVPWDVLDTGIDKNWLKEDLKRALAAITVPDCSFEGCSHCGVCGVDFGHNIVVAPRTIPPYAGHFSPKGDRIQRLRLWMGKLGNMALISHLDLLRLFDRALRRADLPISFTGGYHPGPRIAPANALTLGYTSEGEIVDFELTELMDPEEFRQRLTAQLPAELPIYRIEPVAVKAPSASQILDQAEYILRLGLTPSSDPEGPFGVAQDRPLPGSDWQRWIEEILAAKEIEWEHTTKRGKVKWVNLRDRLFELEQVEVSTDALTCTLRVLGSCRHDGTLLRPTHILYMFERMAKREFELLHAHRKQLILAEI